MENVIVALITGGMALIGVVITNYASNSKIEADLSKAQAVTDTKIEELTREVREHNNFARRVPVLESKVESLEKKVEGLMK